MLFDAKSILLLNQLDQKIIFEYRLEFDGKNLEMTVDGLVNLF